MGKPHDFCFLLFYKEVGSDSVECLNFKRIMTCYKRYKQGAIQSPARPTFLNY